MAKGVPRWTPLLSGLCNGREMKPRSIRPLQVADFTAYYLAKAYRKVYREADKRPAMALRALHPAFVEHCRALSVTAGWRR